MVGGLGLFSVLYLFSSHILVTRQGPGMRAARPGAKSVGLDDADNDDVPYDQDPRLGAGGPGPGPGLQQLHQQNEPAEGPMDYIELQCDGGTPAVDLSYWKDIPQDK